MSHARFTPTCAAHGCGTTVQRGQLMCKPHWFSLPKPLRDEVWRMWKAFNSHRTPAGGDPRPAMAKMRAYRDAVRAAVDYLGAVPVSPAQVFSAEATDQRGRPVRFEQGRLL